jgi:dimethylhistidine N-methyltransferase
VINPAIHVGRNPTFGQTASADFAAIGPIVTAVGAIELEDQGPAQREFLADVLSGMRRTERALPCKYFYDAVGSKLFDEICELDEYYPTRTELRIMRDNAPAIAAQIGTGVRLVEYGSGSSTKTRILLDHLESPAAYVPVDISHEHLQGTADLLSVAYPDIEILPVCADFTETFQLPTPTRTPTHSAVYFPGSTIGNFEPNDAVDLLARITPLCGSGGGLVIGVDLQKDTSVLEAAYNDAAGVTARFNLNLLHRINRELGADFDLSQYAHSARYNEDFGRIEISLVSRTAQRVTIDDECFDIAAGEAICTEYSHKYTIEGFAALAAKAGLTLHRYWTDERQWFGVLHFVTKC